MLGLLQSLLVASHEDQRRNGDEETEHEHNGSDWSCQPMHIVAEEVASQFVVCDPDDAPQSVVKGLLPFLLSCPDGHLLRLTLAFRETDPLRFARFTDGKQNGEDPILELRLDIVCIDRPGEGDRSFKRA